MLIYMILVVQFKYEEASETLQDSTAFTVGKRLDLIKSLERVKLKRAWENFLIPRETQLFTRVSMLDH